MIVSPCLGAASMIACITGFTYAIQDAYYGDFAGLPLMHQVHLQREALAVKRMLAGIVGMRLGELICMSIQQNAAGIFVAYFDELARVGQILGMAGVCK